MPSYDSKNYLSFKKKIIKNLVRCQKLSSEIKCPILSPPLYVTKNTYDGNNSMVSNNNNGVNKKRKRKIN